MTNVSVLSIAACCLLAIWPLVAVADDNLQALEEQAIQEAVRNVAPSVVRIETIGGLEKVGQLLVSSAPTTGVVVGQDGYIISSAFNFIQKPSSILVSWPDGRRSAATIVARDHSRMLVLLKANTDRPLQVAQAAARDEMVVGQWAIAVGRTLDTEQPNPSVGIISAKERIWSKAIQTDAKVSPSNYGGPLIDIRGRVLGILVPLSPHGQGEVAGAEWYDSGIGFAVPLQDLFARLDELKGGANLHRGILGVTLKSGDIYSLPAHIAACHPSGPATTAGLKAGDTIVEVDGVHIERQAQLKHALGPRYAGDTVQLVALRDGQNHEFDVTLTDRLEPYEHPFLGILPMRGTENGVLVRFVYPESPAAEAGIQPGDRIVGAGGEPISDANTLREVLALIHERQDVPIEFQRDGQTTKTQVSLVALPEGIPANLPPAWMADRESQAEQAKVPTGVVPIKIPEQANECFAFVPDNYRADTAHGILMWLHEPGGFDQLQLVERWQNHCKDDHLILIAPKSNDAARWHRTEARFIRKALDQVLSTYHIDRNRIVVHGYQAGAAMAYLVGFTHHELFHGIAAVDAPLPRFTRPPGNDPLHRMAIFSTTAETTPLADRIEAGVERLRKLRYPVTVLNQGPGARKLIEDELRQLTRWIDALDRI